MNSPEGFYFYDCKGVASGLNKSDINGGCCLPGEQTCNKCFYTKLECEKEFGCDTRATNQGCGCNEPAPGACGCNRPNLTCNTPPKTSLDSINCACVCPTTCLAGQTQNSTTCACSCPTTCPAGQTQNSTTCACSCPPGQSLVGGVCSESCSYKISFKHVGDVDGVASGAKLINETTNTPAQTITVEAKEQELYNLSCIQKIFCDCYITGRKDGKCVPGTDYWSSYSKDGVPLTQGYEKLSDECVVIKLADLETPGQCGILAAKHMNTIRDKQRCRTRKGNTHGCDDSDPLTAACKSNTNSVSILIDKDCRPLPATATNKLCGDFNATTAWTPISLMWTGQKSKETSLVSFPLNPNTPNNFYTWEASAEMPLLVYDPEHSGVITSGAQLFGNWTWGGKRQASLNATLASGTSWKDGFEALAELDSDKNGKIDGAELAPIGLWFDSNRDGVSQKGEVVSAIEKEITALYFSPDNIQPNAKEITASVGFERVTGETTITGKAIDWLADEAGSKFELALRSQVNRLISSNGSSDFEEQLNQKKDSDYGSIAGAMKFAGTWRWLIKNDNPAIKDMIPFGTLMIMLDGKEARGRSILEVPLVNITAGEKGAKLIAHTPIKGAFTLENGKVLFKFSVLDGKKVIATSVAKISEDGKKLIGITTTAGDDKNHPNLSYEWEAERI